MRTISLVALVLALTSLAPSGAALASEGGHHHHVAVFGGATTHGSTTNATIGADYEYRIIELLGAGLLVDAQLGHGYPVIFGAGLLLHPFMGLRLLAAPGLEYVESHSAFVMRLGAAYDIPVGPATVAPTFDLDMVSGELAYVYGLSVGIGL